MGLFGKKKRKVVGLDYIMCHNKGEALFHLGRYEEAIECYDRLLESLPKDSHTWNDKAIALSRLGRDEEAIECYDRALDIEPKDAVVWNNKGNTLYSLDRYEEAIECYNWALDIEPKDAVVWNNKGEALFHLGRYEEAIECYDRALEIDPSLEFARENRKKAAKAAEQLKKEKIEREKKLRKAEDFKEKGEFSEASKIYRKLGEEEKAREMEELYRRELRKAKGYEKALNYEKAAELYEELEMWDDARRCREAIKEHSKKKAIKRHINIPEEEKEKMNLIGVGDFFSYNIGTKIGHGSFSKVYFVEDKGGNEFAMKIPLDADLKEEETLELSDKVIEGFIKEARIWNMLTERNIPGIVQLYGFGVRPFPWFVMDLCDESLAKRMNKLDFSEKIEVLIKVLNTLNEIHYLGIVHRDIKPQNILFKDGKPLLTDFGLGKALNKASKSSQGYSGTVEYSSPEQFNRKLGGSDRRTDIWQIGVLAYEMFTGKLPFEGDDITEIMFAVLNEEPEHPSDVNPEIPRKLGDAVMKALEKRKEERWQSAIEFKRAIEEVL